MSTKEEDGNGMKVPNCTPLQTGGAGIRKWGKIVSAFAVTKKCPVEENLDKATVAKGMHIKVKDNASFEGKLRFWSIIQSNVCEDVMDHLENQDFGYDVSKLWKFIFSYYNGEDETKLLLAVDELIGFETTEKDVGKSVQRIQDISKKLIDCNGSEQITIPKLCGIIFNAALPEAYETTVAFIRKEKLCLFAACEEVLKTKTVLDGKQKRSKSSKPITTLSNDIQDTINAALNNKRQKTTDDRGKCAHGRFNSSNSPCWDCQPNMRPEKCAHGRFNLSNSPCWDCQPTRRPVCVDCKVPGHKNKSWKQCKSYTPRAGFGGAVHHYEEQEADGLSPAFDDLDGGVITSHETKCKPKSQIAAMLQERDEIAYSKFILSSQSNLWSNAQGSDANKVTIPYFALTVAENYWQSNESKVILDSGACRTYLKNKFLISNFIDQLSFVRTAQKGSILDCLGIGTFRIQNISIPEARYCPDMSLNLLSVSQLCDQGLHVGFDAKQCTVTKGKEIVLIAKRQDNLYCFEVMDNLEFAGAGISKMMKPTVMTTHLWHRRMGHLNFKGLAHLQALVDGLCIGPLPDEHCDCCLRTKLTRKSFKPSTSHAARPGELIHSDIVQFEVESLNGYRYMISFIDDYSRFIVVYLLKQKSDTFTAFKRFNARFNNMYGRDIGTLRSDGRSNPKGTEYHSGAMKQYCEDHGIHQESSCAHTPEENSRAERPNRTIVEGSNC